MRRCSTFTRSRYGGPKYDLARLAKEGLVTAIEFDTDKQLAGAFVRAISGVIAWYNCRQFLEVGALANMWPSKPRDYEVALPRYCYVLNRS